MADLTRRAALKLGAALGVSTLSLRPAEAQPGPSVPSSATGLDRLEADMRAGDVLLASPTHEHDPAVYEFLASAKFLDPAWKADVGTIALEFPAQVQSQADSLAAARTPQAVYEQRMNFLTVAKRQYHSLDLNEAKRDRMLNSVADLILSAASPPPGKPPMRVVFSDRSEYPDSVETKAFLKAMDYRQDVSRLTQAQMMKLGERLAGDYPEKMPAALDAVVSSRKTPEANAQILSVIDRESKPGRHRVIVEGAGHAGLLGAAIRAEGRHLAVVALHQSRVDYERNLKDPDQMKQGVDFSRMDNFLMDTSRFIGESSPVPASAPSASPERPARRSPRR